VNGFFTAIFRPNPGVRARAKTRVGAQSRAQSGAQSIQALMTLSNGDKSAWEVAEAIGLRSKTGALKRTLNELLAGGLIEYTLPEKPSSRLQRYRLTRAGLEYLKEEGTPLRVAQCLSDQGHLELFEKRGKMIADFFGLFPVALVDHWLGRRR